MPPLLAFYRLVYIFWAGMMPAFFYAFINVRVITAGVWLLAMLVPALLVAGAANAAEIYNKDGNKLDLYGKVAGLHYFSDDASSDGDMSYARIGFKGETQIADQFTGYGQWEFNIGAN
eukprot:gene23796-28434_t